MPRNNAAACSGVETWPPCAIATDSIPACSTLSPPAVASAAVRRASSGANPYCLDSDVATRAASSNRPIAPKPLSCWANPAPPSRPSRSHRAGLQRRPRPGPSRAARFGISSSPPCSSQTPIAPPASLALLLLLSRRLPRAQIDNQKIALCSKFVSLPPDRLKRKSKLTDRRPQTHRHATFEWFPPALHRRYTRDARFILRPPGPSCLAACADVAVVVRPVDRGRSRLLSLFADWARSGRTMRIPR